MGAAGAVAAIIVAFVIPGTAPATQGARHDVPPARRAALPARAESYLGLYRPGAPASYAQVTAFTAATGVRPDMVVYYSGWLEPFQASFAAAAARHSAVPLVQIDPTNVSLAAIAAGHYDSYLDAYAAAVRSYHHQVILSFGHEMNGWWYSWGHRHASPAAFVAAWRHIVSLFRKRGATNVTWLWTVNVVNTRHGTPKPTRWWPGARYVTWIGIDGYYLKSSWTFASLFGPTIKDVRALSREPIPILISETGAAPAAGKPAKIADLFAGVRAYGLLGFVWFDAGGSQDWRLNSPEALAAYRQGAKAYSRSAS